MNEIKVKKNRILTKSSDNVPAFLLKTYEILENPNYANIVSWNDDGSAFRVKNVNSFSNEVLPKHFKHNNFASFVRQLNMYDFHKSRQDNNENEFQHKLFKKGYKSYLPQIKRKSGNTENQITLPHNKNISEYKELVMEMALLSNKQGELEKLIRIIIKQNEKFLKENKYLWNELIRNKQKSETKNDKLIYWFLQSLKNNPKTYQSQTQNGNSLLMLKDDEKIGFPQTENQNDNPEAQQSLPNISANGYKMIEEQTNGLEFDGLTKNQIIQGLLQIFGQKGKKYNDDDSQSSFEIPIKKKRKKSKQVPLMLQDHFQTPDDQPKENELISDFFLNSREIMHDSPQVNFFQEHNQQEQFNIHDFAV